MTLDQILCLTPAQFHEHMKGECAALRESGDLLRRTSSAIRAGAAMGTDKDGIALAIAKADTLMSAADILDEAASETENMSAEQVKATLDQYKALARR